MSQRYGAVCAFLSLAMSACAVSGDKEPVRDTAGIVATEFAFARHARERGTTAAFLAYIHDEGVLFRPYAVNGRQRLQQQTNRIGPPYLSWWPSWSGMSQSGDLGFNVGPYVVGDNDSQGYFFTIWRQQPDGQWKFFIDHGIQGHDDMDTSQVGTPDDVVELAVAKASNKLLQQLGGLDIVLQREAAFAQSAQQATQSAYSEYLSGNALLLRDKRVLASNPDEHLKLLQAEPFSISFSYVDGGVSEAGDLAYTYGRARWSGEGESSYGVFVRVWQLYPAGWRIVADAVTSAPKPE